MNINKIPEGFEIKDKDVTVTVSRSKIKVNNFVINAPGEYDVAGATCEVKQIITGINILIDTEGVLFAALSPNIGLNDLDEEIARVAIVLLLVNPGDDSKKISEIIAKIEPQLVFYSLPSDFNLPDIQDLEKIEKNYKIGKLDLEIEGTRHFVIE